MRLTTTIESPAEKKVVDREGLSSEVEESKRRASKQVRKCRDSGDSGLPPRLHLPFRVSLRAAKL